MTDLKVGHGHPDPEHPSNKLDPKLFDWEGRPIVSRKPWSEAKTGLYITIGVSRTKPVGRIVTNTILKKQTNLHLWPQGSAWIFLSTSEGVPRWSVDVWGASLELPDDLGRDKLKMQYVSEWLRDTLAEALGQAVVADAFTGFTRHHLVSSWIYETSNKAINEIGL